jgi:P-type Cu+ transporter
MLIWLKLLQWGMNKAQKTESNTAENTLNLSIDGMTCAACVRRVETVLGKVAGVQGASVNLAARRAAVKIVAGLADPDLHEHLMAAVQKAGFEAHVIQADAPVVSPAFQTALETKVLRRQFWLAAVLTLPVFVVEMGGHLYAPFHHWLSQHLATAVSHALQALLTTAVLAGPGRHFFTQGLKALWARQPEMNSLVAVGAGSAWLFSMAVWIAPGWIPETARHVYFEAAAVIVTLILLGRLFEAKARGQTGAAIERLIGLQPKIARRIEDGQDVDVAIDTVKPGDLLRVRPGEKIPVDGVIQTGDPYIDQSMITGEPIPVAFKPGDSVAGGTLNTTVSFTFQATHTGSDTVLARIIRMVQTAQDAKLPIQALVDRVTSVFVPVIMAIAVLTFVVWWSLTGDVSQAVVSAVAVLIIACPCAMGLATPTSIMVGTGRAAELGVLFRQGDALQQLKRVQVMAFDKTGTLTQGHPSLTRFESRHPDIDPTQLLRMVAQLQQQSEHPIAKAIVNAAQESEAVASDQPPKTRLVIDQFEAVKGLGVIARVKTQPNADDPSGQSSGESSFVVAVGSEALMNQQGIDVSDTRAQIETWARQGETPVHVAMDGRLVGLLAVADAVKPEARATIAQLRAMGIEVAMVTGDHPLTADAVAKTLGIETVFAQVKPQDKVRVVKAMQANVPYEALPSESRPQTNPATERRVVAFVGDGINDAPALAQADVGVAIGTGTDVAIEAASVVLMSGQLSKVVTALDASRATLANIKQNLFWAFAYNAALVPVAAGVLYPVNGLLLSPMLAAFAMAFSSVFVVANALRLKTLKARSA